MFAIQKYGLYAHYYPRRHILTYSDKNLFWVPDNILAGALLDYVTASEPLPAMMNFVHPRPSTWGDVLKGISAALGDIPFVPVSDWVAKLEALLKTATADDYRRAVSRTRRLTNLPSLNTLGIHSLR